MTSHSDSPEGRRVDAYLATIERFEPEIALTDADAARTSMAISLKRIADAMEKMIELADKIT